MTSLDEMDEKDYIFIVPSGKLIGMDLLDLSFNEDYSCGVGSGYCGSHSIFMPTHVHPENIDLTDYISDKFKIHEEIVDGYRKPDFTPACLLSAVQVREEIKCVIENEQKEWRRNNCSMPLILLSRRIEEMWNS